MAETLRKQIEKCRPYNVGKIVRITIPVGNGRTLEAPVKVLVNDQGDLVVTTYLSFKK